MRCDILTLFPDLCRAPLESSILGRARQAGLLQVQLTDIRDFTEDRHRTVDDTPYGGGDGMILKPEPVFRAVRSVPGHQEACRILLTPQGEPFRQALARELSVEPHLILICGRYEGFDERIRFLASREISLGDFVLTGGEIAALAVLDATARLIPGVLGSETSVDEESFSGGLLEYPHYTRPQEFEGMLVPPELLTGNHLRIALWRRFRQLARTHQRRPDLLEGTALAPLDQLMLKDIQEGFSFGEGADRYLREAKRHGPG